MDKLPETLKISILRPKVHIGLSKWTSNKAWKCQSPMFNVIAILQDIQYIQIYNSNV